MSRQLLSRSPDLQRLESDGYALTFPAEGFLAVKVPYVNADREIVEGILVTPLEISGDATTPNPNHVVYFVGAADNEIPCTDAGQPLTHLVNQAGPIDLGSGLVASCSFSHKPNPTYTDYYEKMSTYADMLVAYAQAIDPQVTARTHPPIATDEGESVFRYIDSASARARIGAAVDKLRLDQVVIVGLGGTGSYILDAVAKTPVREIHLYDGDTQLTHNAFRSPGAATLAELNAAPKKVHYLQAKYDAIHRGVIAHPEHIDTSNIHELDDASFVILAMDSGPAKKLIIEHLQAQAVPFVDAGMGIYQKGVSLAGIIRTTISVPGRDSEILSEQSFADEDEEDEYEQNIQIADLNMLNAALAVIRWKRLFGFYVDFEDEVTSLYTIDGNHLINEGSPT
jgi:Domain of unknown function (DUF6791)/ThiF family